MSGDVLQLIATETHEESYKAHKIELDLETDTASRIDSQKPILTNPKSGETIKHTTYMVIGEVVVSNFSKWYANSDIFFLRFAPRLQD